MTILITILAVIASLIVLFLVAALLAKKKYEISREIIINSPNQQVFDYVRMMRNQDHYSKWVMTDPEKKVDFRGTDGSVGAIYGWSGNKRAGEGEQEIISVKAGELVETEVRFIRPFPSKAHMIMSTQSEGVNKTRLKWEVRSPMKYPMNLLLVMMRLETMLGRDMEVSLDRLKEIMER